MVSALKLAIAQQLAIYVWEVGSASADCRYMMIATHYKLKPRIEQAIRQQHAWTYVCMCFVARALLADPVCSYPIHTQQS